MPDLPLHDVVLAINAGHALHRSRHVWGHSPEQRVHLRRYSFDHRLAIAQADARPITSISLPYDST